MSNFSQVKEILASVFCIHLYICWHGVGDWVYAQLGLKVNMISRIRRMWEIGLMQSLRKKKRKNSNIEVTTQTVLFKVVNLGMEVKVEEEEHDTLATTNTQVREKFLKS